MNITTLSNDDELTTEKIHTTEKSLSSNTNLIIGVSVGCGLGVILIVLAVIIFIKLKVCRKSESETQRPPGILDITPANASATENNKTINRNDFKNTEHSSEESEFSDEDDYENKSAIEHFHSSLSNLQPKNNCQTIPPPVPPKDYVKE
ncbi:DgyrCDS8853 [Dimorphilus gyrociliatus]|uniref:DgyrCDS8853 n=1 Tax=Dimorphilus gyrociliatus TaxID=2664684 RepID=A0A7I8VVC2_9ANNE|nr:DgyrCDS8853 [Dimorphilus gyrociliatus]